MTDRHRPSGHVLAGLLASFVLAGGIPGGVAHATTLHVPADHATIQAAIVAATAGDTVLVAPGRYKELIQMKNGVVLRSAAGPDSTTLVTAGLAPDALSERLVECLAGIDRSTVIEGFTLDSDGIRGSAIYCEGASPTIRDNVIRGFGWGINLRDGADALIDRNVIAGGRSFGIAIFASSPEIRRNTITDNEPRGITISGRKSKPVIGGRREYANRIFGQMLAIVNESRNDIDATWNDWGWRETIEMERAAYPADITAIVDGNDRGPSHRGKGVVDDRNWIRPPDPDTGGTGSAMAPAPPATPSATTGETAAGAPASASTTEGNGAGPAVGATDARATSPRAGNRWVLPAAFALGLVALFVLVSRRNSR